MATNRMRASDAERKTMERVCKRLMTAVYRKFGGEKTLRELEELTGVGFATLSRLNRGMPPDAFTLRKLIAVSGADANDVLALRKIVPMEEPAHDPR